MPNSEFSSLNRLILALLIWTAGCASKPFIYIPNPKTAALSSGGRLWIESFKDSRPLFEDGARAGQVPEGNYYNLMEGGWRPYLDSEAFASILDQDLSAAGIFSSVETAAKAASRPQGSDLILGGEIFHLSVTDDPGATSSNYFFQTQFVLRKAEDNAPVWRKIVQHGERRGYREVLNHPDQVGLQVLQKYMMEIRKELASALQGSLEPIGEGGEGQRTQPIKGSVQEMLRQIQKELEEAE